MPDPSEGVGGSESAGSVNISLPGWMLGSLLRGGLISGKLPGEYPASSGGLRLLALAVPVN